MDIFKILGIGIITSILVVVVKQIKPELSIFVGIAGGLIIVFMIVATLLDIVNVFSTIATKSGLSNNLFVCLLKIIGIGYLTEFASNVCIDSGSSGLADKMLLAGKIVILSMALPVVMTILDIIIGLLP